MCHKNDKFSSRRPVGHVHWQQVCETNLTYLWLKCLKNLYTNTYIENVIKVLYNIKMGFANQNPGLKLQQCLNKPFLMFVKQPGAVFTRTIFKIILSLTNDLTNRLLVLHFHMC